MAVAFHNTEDLRVLLNLLTIDVVLSANFLKNLKPEVAEELLAEVKNPELDQLYRFLIR